MFTQPERRNASWRASLLVSFALHCAVLYLAIPVIHPRFLMPSSVAFGRGGSSVELIYYPRQGSDPESASSKNPRDERLSLPRVRARKVEARKPQPPLQSVTERPGNAVAARAGSPYGSLLNGPIDGHDVRPALPVIFADPAISRAEIPAGVEGNVIVEITIDAQGIVIATKVLQGLGHGIEEKVVAAVRNWRFRPATVDGVATASQQDVYFHFPS